MSVTSGGAHDRRRQLDGSRQAGEQLPRPGPEQQQVTEQVRAEQIETDRVQDVPGDGR